MRRAGLAVAVALACALLGSAPEARAQSKSKAVAPEAARPGRWNNKPPAGWTVLETQHYQVQSRLAKVPTRALAEHLESMLDLYRTFLPTRRKLDTFVLKLFRNREEFLQYSGYDAATGPVGYFDPEHGELAAYDTGVILGHRSSPTHIGLAIGVADQLTMSQRQGLSPLFEAITDAWTIDTARVLSHEGWHQYFRAYTVSVVEMPAWLDEGVGDYFFTATWDETHEAASGYDLGALNLFRLRDLQPALSESTTVSLRELLGYTRNEYYANAPVFYAQGWSLVQFLMHNQVVAYRSLVPRLIADFKDTKNFERSTATVFAGIDIDALDREWSAWVRSLKVNDPLEELARQYGRILKGSDLIADSRWIEAYRWYVAHPPRAAEAAAAEPPGPVAPEPAGEGPR